MEKEKKLLSWGEAWKLNRRAFTLIYKRFPQMILSRLLCIAWEALTPYLGIYLPSLLIGELAGDRNLSVLKNLVLLALGTVLYGKYLKKHPFLSLHCTERINQNWTHRFQIKKAIDSLLRIYRFLLSCHTKIRS